MNHVFVDFENVHKVDLAVIGSEAVSFTLLVGARQTKLDVALVEKLFEHAVSVQLVRLTSSGKNALDFTIAFYVGRAVAADPTGHFHIVSRDTGYDPLIAHLRSRHISAYRHSSFESLPFVSPAKPATPIAAPVRKAKPQAQAKVVADDLNELEAQVLEHFRTHPTARPRTQKSLIRFLIAHLGHKITEPEVMSLIKGLGQAGCLVIGDKDRVTYYLDTTPGQRVETLYVKKG